MVCALTQHNAYHTANQAAEGRSSAGSLTQHVRYRRPRCLFCHTRSLAYRQHLGPTACHPSTSSRSATSSSDQHSEGINKSAYFSAEYGEYNGRSPGYSVRPPPQPVIWKRPALMTTITATQHQLQDVSDLLGLRGQLQPTNGSDGASSRDSESSTERESSPPTNAVSARERWNSSRSNISKTLSTFLGFIVMGANDAAYGAILPYLQQYYSISYIVVSLVFLSPFVGYIAAACSNNLMHKKFGQRGVAIIGPSAHLIAYIVICLHPPYPVLVVVFILAGYGCGLLDAAWNSWLGNLANPNELLGFLHGFYGLGAVISPLVATTMMTQGDLPWYAFYYIMIGGATLELATSTAAFWHMTGQRFRAVLSDDVTRGATRAALKTRVAWVSATFLLIYVGIEVALGGWIVEFMIQVRDGAPFQSGLVATGFWLGITVGRVVLGFVTPRVGQNLAIFIYLLCAMGMQLLFWLVPQFIVSSIAAALVGFFLGPLFPAVVVATTKLLPAHLHVVTIGFAAAFGGGGACILPFAVGAIAQNAGVRVLQPIILAMLCLALALWTFGMPRIGVQEGAKEGKLDQAKGAASRVFFGCLSARL